MRRAVFVMLFEREFIDKLRKPVVINALGFGVLILLGWSWLAPAFHSSFAGDPEPDASIQPNLWLMAVWLTAGPVRPADAGTDEPEDLPWDHNAYYPAPEMHKDAAKALLEVVKGLSDELS